MSCQSQTTAAAEAGQKSGGIPRSSSKRAYAIGLGIAVGGTAAAAGTYLLLSRTNAGKTTWRVMENLADKRSGTSPGPLSTAASSSALVPAFPTREISPLDNPRSRHLLTDIIMIRETLSLSNPGGTRLLADVAEKALRTDTASRLLSAKGSTTAPGSQSNLLLPDGRGEEKSDTSTLASTTTPDQVEPTGQTQGKPLRVDGDHLSQVRKDKKKLPSLSDKPAPAIRQAPVALIMPAQGRLPGAKRIQSPLRMAVGVNDRRGIIYQKISNGFVMFERGRRGEYEPTGLAISPALAVTNVDKKKGIVRYGEDTSRWGILHIPSGRMVSGRMEGGQLVDGWPFKSPDDATMAARMLASTDDWTEELDNLSRAQIKRKDDLIDQYIGREQRRPQLDEDEGE